MVCINKCVENILWVQPMRTLLVLVILQTELAKNKKQAAAEEW